MDSFASRPIARFLLPAVAAASLFTSGCSSSEVRCPCPASGITSVMLPGAQSSPIVSLSADPPCTATDGGAHTVMVTRQTAGTCQVHVQLMSGDTYAFSVEFAVTGGGCCAGLVSRVDASVPELVDAGAGD